MCPRPSRSIGTRVCFNAFRKLGQGCMSKVKKLRHVGLRLHVDEADRAHGCDQARRDLLCRGGDVKKHTPCARQKDGRGKGEEGWKEAEGVEGRKETGIRINGDGDSKMLTQACARYATPSPSRMYSEGRADWGGRKRASSVSAEVGRYYVEG